MKIFEKIMLLTLVKHISCLDDIECKHLISGNVPSKMSIFKHCNILAFSFYMMLEWKYFFHTLKL